ncbi:hypothetical protein FDG92_gp07 [Arthrobacter phage Jasmine]|uniref:Uncharacterized protein n=1 Tax=Arthrobacter phage Jasmine TaxID=1772302 RepID=A0A0U4ILT2_9CAUD|nr:hypothetical protein FDG92_gp07 [Arthrobacter phage Jasmine]ALY09279.1 hypothetical protein JASMINE_7 [Arthrobacter phage Jasmine]
MSQPAEETPDVNVVRKFHTYADTDSSNEAIHHTLGPGVNQAASGGHTHNGSDSPLLLEGVTISGAKGGNTALASVIAALTGMGATDSTTA